MSKKLNRVTDEAAAQEVQGTPGALAKRAARPYATLTVDERYRHASSVASMYVNLGQCKYQLDYANADIAQDLASGAHWKAAQVELVASGAVKKTIVWSLFMHNLGLVCAFGSALERSTLAAFPSDQITGTPDRNAPGCEVARLWKHSLNSSSVPHALLAEQLRRCEAENADRWDRQWTHGIARSLLAIGARDPAELQAGLEEIARFTEHEALRGDWQRSGDGQLSLVGLGICRLGRDAGVEPVINSIYIPLGLLEGAP